MLYQSFNLGRLATWEMFFKLWWMFYCTLKRASWWPVLWDRCFCVGCTLMWIPKNYHWGKTASTLQNTMYSCYSVFILQAKPAVTLYLCAFCFISLTHWIHDNSLWLVLSHSKIKLDTCFRNETLLKNC